MQQANQPIPQGLPPNIMANWATMTPQMRAQVLAYLGMNGQQPPTQLASPNGMPPPPSRVIVTPQMADYWNPRMPSGDPMQMNANNAYLSKMEGIRDRSGSDDSGYSNWPTQYSIR